MAKRLTVNEALRRAAPTRDRQVARALATLAGAELRDRSAAWRLTHVVDTSVLTRN